MNRKIKTKIVVSIIFVILAIVGWLIYWQTSHYIVGSDWNRYAGKTVIEDKGAPSGNEKTKAGIANPASVYCEEQGGKLEIREALNGGQIGYCVFDSGKECEEWSYFRGECSPSGTGQKIDKRKTTLKKISQGERYTNYEGSITVSGRYQEYNPDTLHGEILCFDADEKTGYLVPREPDFWGPGEPDTRNPWFCFSDQAAAKKMLGVDDKKIFADKTVECFSGPATVTVSHYITDKLESETYDKAQLDKVISSGKFSPTCGE